MIKDNMQIRGDVLIKHLDVNGAIIGVRDIKNMIVSVGKEYIASRILNNSTDVIGFMSVGTSTIQAETAQTSLQAPLTPRVAFNATSVNTNVITYNCEMGPGVCTGVLTEAGLFNALTGGTMLSRTVFSPLTKAAGDTIIIVWSITII